MRVARSACTTLILLGLISPASAQSVVQRSFATQLFEPCIGLDCYFSVEGARADEANLGVHLGLDIGLVLNYARKPLSLYYETKQGTTTGGFDIGSAKVIDVIENQLTMDLVGALGIHYKWFHFQVGFGLPVNLLLTGNDINDRGEKIGDLSATGMGDLRLQLKWQFLRDMKGFSLAFSPILTFPTGNKDNFGGDPNVTIRPRLVLSYQIGSFSAAANVGYLIRPESSMIFSSEVGSQLIYGVGAGYQVHKRILVMAELYGRAGFGDQAGCSRDPLTGKTVCSGSSSTKIDSHPLETDIGGRFTVAHGWDLTAGVGFGLLRAIGSPQVRVIAGVRWAPDFKDTDGDGIPDYRDKCPTQPEDKDGFQDDDGCPDPDNDGDMIPDVLDKCPNEAEDKDGFQDEDGCPDPDNDGDKIPDIKDACPFQPETYNGYKDDDGCPDEPDRDGDGIPDKKDKCPDDPEDKDGFEDEDGCPDPDNDNDGVPDKFDDCPNDAEDMDGFKDDDGCPDPDNDGDGICDPWVEKTGQSKKYAKICHGSDKCPNEPETYNGYKDDDGCPDKGASNVKIEEGKLVILKKIFFDTNKATIKKQSNAILGEVAGALMSHREIKKVRIEGHTDSQGKAEKNKTLSQKRAEAVREWLIKKGVDGDRMVAVGYGPEKPIADNRTNKGREQNRRVEFIILEQGSGAAQPTKKARPEPAAKQAPPEPMDDEEPAAKPAKPTKPAKPAPKPAPKR
jgi:OmpA-OmpF porin, OOP family